MKILMLGGTGAIGASLTEILSENDHDIYITTRKPRTSLKKNLNYIVGNAMDDIFLGEVLQKKYDAIIDFMVYNELKLANRLNMLLDSTTQYVFISSSRVYAQSFKPLTNDSERLLDTIADKEYLDTDEYALTKARQENLLANSGRNNWTVIRPYITYSDDRLQLGVYEKEHWLYRALQGRTILFSKDIAEKKTSLTSGIDVAMVMSKLIGNEKAYGKMLHIVNPEVITWRNILEVYIDVFTKKTGKCPKVFYVDNSEELGEILGNKYQIKYDRLYDRVFDDSEIKDICDSDYVFIPAEEGLKKSLEKFLDSKREFRDIAWRYEAYLDKKLGEKTKFKEMCSWKTKIKYLLWRYTPFQF